MQNYFQKNINWFMECSHNKDINWSHLLFLAICLILSCLCIVVGLSGCSSSDLVSSNYTLTDLCGRQNSMDKPADTVVALTASDAEVLYAIGAQEKIIARGSYCDYPEEIIRIQDVGSGEMTNIETIISLHPDAVLMSKMDQTLAQVNSLQNAGLKTFVNEPSTIEQTYDYIRLIGQIVGYENQANKLILEMKQKFENLYSSSHKSANINNDNDKQLKVYFEVSPLQYGLWTAGNNTFMQDICKVLNLKNIFDDCDGWVEISQEQVISRNPDIIISVTMYDGFGVSPKEEILSRKGWDGIEAFKTQQIYTVKNDIITRPGPRLADAATQIYNAIYKKGNS